MGVLFLCGVHCVARDGCASFALSADVSTGGRVHSRADKAMTLGTLASSVFHSSVFHLPLWGGAGTCDGRWMFGAQAFGCWTFGAQLFGCWSFGAQALLWGLSVQSVEDLCSAITCWTLEMTFSSSSPLLDFGDDLFVVISVVQTHL